LRIRAQLAGCRAQGVGSLQGVPPNGTKCPSLKQESSFDDDVVAKANHRPKEDSRCLTIPSASRARGL
jgi:hypothetical protein